MNKKCRRCHIEKDTSNFNPDRLWKYGVWTTCKDCINQKRMENPTPELKRTEVRKVWKKTICRLKEKGSESKVHVEIWKTRPHICQNCWLEIKFFDPSCFAHILSKWMYDKWRYDKNNYALVHSVRDIKNSETLETYNCHWEFDTKMTWKKLEFEKLLEEWDLEKIENFIKLLKK